MKSEKKIQKQMKEKRKGKTGRGLPCRSLRYRLAGAWEENKKGHEGAAHTITTVGRRLDAAWEVTQNPPNPNPNPK